MQTSHTPITRSAAILSKVDALTYRDGRLYRPDGTEAGFLHKYGRYMVGFRDEGGRQGRKVSILRSHVVWYKCTGQWPKMTIHHRDEDKTNDRFENLSELSNEDNRHASSKNGLPIGVRLHPDGKYQARVQKRGRLLHIGLYDTPADAHAAYLAAKSR